MSQITGSASGEASSRFQTSCPYIGMRSDPQTHVGIPDTRNCCHLVNPPREVSINHQQALCLGQHFPSCQIYMTSGEGEAPEGIFEGDGETERSFGLPFLFSRRSQARAAKSATNPSKTVPLVEPEPAKKPQTEPVVEQKAVSIAEVSSSDQPAVQAVAQPVVPARQEEHPPVEDEEELRRRLYNEALSRYDQVSNARRERKGLWAFLMVAALLVLLISVWGIYNRFQNQQRDALLSAEANYTIALATAVQDMGAAADAWGTAASIIDAQNSTATAVVRATQTAAQMAAEMQQTADAAGVLALTATPTTELAVCQNINEASLLIASGPQLTPELRTFYTAGMTNPQASWVVQNSGTCGWSQILLWSVFDNSVTQPIIKRNGQIITPTADPAQSLIAPGEQIELVIEFPASKAQRVNNEWILVVDGLSMLSQPHLILKADSWVVLNPADQPTATRSPRRATPGGTNPTSVIPPRDTPTPDDGGGQPPRSTP
jgi:hypothetical protein